MPGKHVSFADTNVIYSPAPPTPSPTFSISSLPSSTGPITPPGPYLTTLPLPAGVPVHIHPTLGFHAQNPKLRFDLSVVHKAARLNTTPLALIPSQTLFEAATYPPVDRLSIIANLPWKLTVTATTHPFVTVNDVLDFLYRWLRIGVTPLEFNRESPQSQRAITVAFHNRIARDSYTAEIERAKGVKRIDFLKGNHLFLGLSSTKEGPAVWMLNVKTQ